MRMILRPSRPRIAVAWALLACVLVGPLGLTHLDAQGDPDCLPPIVWHDEADHRVEADVQPSAAHAETHCTVCHLLRGSRSVASAARRAPVSPGAASASRTDLPLAQDRQPELRLPSRAPPA